MDAISEAMHLQSDGLAATAAHRSLPPSLPPGIEDNSNNFTRFLLLSRDTVTPPPEVLVKTSVMFSLVDVPGVLFKALGCFALRDIDLLKIESRPAKNIPRGNLPTEVRFPR